jgi:hypothetical protein
MLKYMRTTPDIDEDVLQAAKELAALKRREAAQACQGSSDGLSSARHRARLMLIDRAAPQALHRWPDRLAVDGLPL